MSNNYIIPNSKVVGVSTETQNRDIAIAYQTN